MPWFPTRKYIHHWSHKETLKLRSENYTLLAVRSEARGWRDRDREITCTRTEPSPLCSSACHYYLTHSRYFKMVFLEWMEWLNNESYNILSQFLKRCLFWAFLGKLGSSFRETVNFWGIWIKYRCLACQKPPFILRHDIDVLASAAHLLKPDIDSATVGLPKWECGEKSLYCLLSHVILSVSSVSMLRNCRLKQTYENLQLF